MPNFNLQRQSYPPDPDRVDPNETGEIPGQMLVVNLRNHPLAVQQLVQLMEQAGYPVVAACNAQTGEHLLMYLQPELELQQDLYPDGYLPNQITQGQPEPSLGDPMARQQAIALSQAQLYQAAQAQVRELKRLNGLKDDFLNIVSHELRSPMANMRMAIEMLELLICTNSSHALTVNHHPNCVRMAEYLQILKQECDREISLINDLLDLQRLESGQHNSASMTLNLIDWFNKLVQTFEMRLQERQQTLDINLASNLPPLRTDSMALHRLVTELLSNACKYSPPGATISLNVQVVEQHLHLRISNPGSSIPPEAMDRIFEKFYRVPQGDRWHQGGTGLGLALVKQLIEAMQGQIWVTSDATQTCFSVHLPLNPPSHAGPV